MIWPENPIECLALCWGRSESACSTDTAKVAPKAKPAPAPAPLNVEGLI